jgi:transcriptional regulator with XRE-family HTH domain
MVARMDPFSTRLRAAREAQSLSQEGLAKLALLSTDVLARLERGAEPKGGAVVELARVLGVSCDHLLGLDTVPAPTAVEDRADLTPDMRRLLKTARRLGVRELNLLAQLADAFLAKQAEP